MSIYRRLRRWLGAEDGMSNIVPGNVAPGFSLKSLEGKEFVLGSALQRGPVVLAFFKVSCPVCKFTFPFLERVFKQYGGGGVSFLCVFQDKASAVRDFARAIGVTISFLVVRVGFQVSTCYN